MTKQEAVEYLINKNVINGTNYRVVEQILKMDKSYDETMEMIKVSLRLDKTVQEMIEEDKKQEEKKDQAPQEEMDQPTQEKNTDQEKNIDIGNEDERQQKELDEYYNNYYQTKEDNEQYKYSDITIMTVPNDKNIAVYIGLTDENGQYIRDQFSAMEVENNEKAYDKTIPTDLKNIQTETMESYEAGNENYNLFRNYYNGPKVINTNIGNEIVENIKNKQIAKNTILKENTKKLVLTRNEDKINKNAAFVDSLLLSFLSGIIGGVILTIMLHFIK